MAEHPIQRLFADLENAQAIVDQILGQFLSAIQATFSLAILGRSRDDTGGIDQMWGAMPETWRVHLMLTPVFFDALRLYVLDPSDERMATIASYVRDEFDISGNVGALSTRDAVWSPLNDVFVRRENREVVAVNSAKRIGDVIIANFDGPNATRMDLRNRVLRYAPESFLPDERAAVLRKASDAVASLDRTHQAFGNIVRSFTRSIIFRKTLAVTEYAFEMDPHRHGEMQVLNAHTTDLSVPRFAEALLFEAIRSAALMCDVGHGSLVNTNARTQPLILSPWTLECVDSSSIPSIALAAFSVYRYALCEIDQSPLTSRARQDAIDRRDRSASGFATTVPLSRHVADVLPRLPDYAVRLLDALQLDVCGSIELCPTSASARSDPRRGGDR